MTVPSEVDGAGSPVDKAPHSMADSETLLENTTVRPVEEGELQTVSLIFLEAYRNDLESGRDWRQETAFTYLDRWYSNAGELFLVAECQGVLIATISPLIIKEALYGFELFITPVFQNKGLAGLLIGELEQALQSRFPDSTITVLTRAGIGPDEALPEGVSVEHRF